MEYRKLGNTDIKVSLICLGTMTFGEQNSESQAHELLNHALSEGLNFIDTAEMYSIPGRRETQGSTERFIGTWIRKRAKRDDFILATKVTGPSTGMPYIRDPMNFSPKQIRQAIEGSLKRLQTDYIDLYQLHWPERHTNCFGVRGFIVDPEDPWVENIQSVIETMSSLKMEGKIRHYGLSNETPWGVLKFFQLADQMGVDRPLSIQNPYNLLNRTFEIGLAEICHRENLGLLAYSPLAFGLLSAKHHESGYDLSKTRLQLFRQMARYNSEITQIAASQYFKIACEFNLNFAQMALAFVNSRSYLNSTIIGATNLEQLKENINSIKLSLNDAIQMEIEKVHSRYPNPAP